MIFGGNMRNLLNVDALYRYRFFNVILLTVVSILSVDGAFARGVDYNDIYGPDEGGTPDILYLVIWVTVCAAIASLYKLYDKLNGSNVELSEKIYTTVIVGSMAGALHGFCITFAVIVAAMIADGIFSLHISSFVLKKTNLIVLFFASVNVAGLMYVLRKSENVIVRTKDVEITYKD